MTDDPIAITAHKHAAIIPISCCQLTDTTGVNHCDHPEPPPWRPTWRQRLRNRWHLLRYWLGRRLGSWIAGVRFVIDVDRDDDR